MVATLQTRKPSPAAALSGSHQEQCDYRASKRETKLRPRPRGIRSLGSSADWHFRRDSDHLWVGELGREYDRNSPIGKRLLDLVERNVLQDVGFTLNPDTGSESLDKELKQWWEELSGNPQRIDIQGEHDFHQLSKIVLRDTFAAGDIFGMFTVDGPIELRESHLCRQPYKRGVKHKNNVLGIELTEQRRRLGAWFTKEPISPFDTYRVKHSDLQFVDAWDVSTDWKTRNFLHVCDRKRITQTRGVSLFAPVFDYLGMFEDSNFQQLVKQQLANMFLIKRERSGDFNPAGYVSQPNSGVESSQQSGTVDRLLEELYPGAELRGLKNEKIDLLSPNIPANEWFNHMKLVGRIIGVGWGVAYVMLMLDTSDTTFHGYRGQILESRDTFKNWQKWFAKQWHTPCYKQYLHRFADENPAIARYRERSLREKRQKRDRPFDLFRHTWTLPGWPSVDDVKDATADTMRIANSLTSYRRAIQSQDVEWGQLIQEIVEDRGLAWLLSATRYIENLAKVLEVASKNGIEVNIGPLTLADIERGASIVAPMPQPENVQLSMSLQGGGEPVPGGGDE